MAAKKSTEPSPVSIARAERQRVFAEEVLGRWQISSNRPLRFARIWNVFAPRGKPGKQRKRELERLFRLR